MKSLSKRLKPDTLKGQLMFWASLLLLLVGVSSIVIVSLIEYKDRKEEVVAQLEEVLGVQELFIDSWFQERKTDLKTIAKLKEVRTHNSKEIESILYFTLESKKEFSNLHYINNEGVIEFTTLEDAGGVNVSDRKYYQKAINGQSYISDVLVGRIAGNLYVFISNPVKDDQGQIQGVIMGAVQLQTIEKILNKYNLGETGETYLIHQQGGLITLPRLINTLKKTEKIKRMDYRIDTKIVKAAKQGTKLIDSYQDYRGKAVFGTYRKINNDRWLIIGEIDASEALASLYQQILLISLAILVIVAVLIYITKRLIERIERPMEYLLEGTQMLEAGKYDYKIDFKAIPSAPVEFIQLCNTFNTMAEEINKNIKLLEENKERYRSLFRNNIAAVFSIDLEGRFLDINSAAQQLTGYFKEELIGSFFTELLPQDQIEKGRNLFLDTAKGKAELVELTIVDKEDNRIELMLTSMPIIINNKIIGVYKIAIDITENKRNEERIFKVSEELRRSNKDLQQFAYVASHDLQEPLRMVTSYLQLLERRYKDKLDEDANEFINFAVDGAKRMQTLINDLLEYSRVNTRGKEFKEIDGNQLIEEVKRNLSIFIEEKNAKIIYEPLADFYGDRVQLVQLFQNLIQNGIKFNDKEEPQIDISMEEKDDAWQFAISDNGIGFSAEYSERIFTIFQRLHSYNEYQGTGIGLAICKRIVERHGGEIWVESEEGKGSTFYFTIKQRRI
ncbi:PAS domain S-box-containing protein [Orenia metallireducens]|jgi:PAS domain S-box-containing protein|uniref:histidine kinase n=1 Tax=Orenia metallireducens TaxID=1413210 RepID=A0A285GPR4_9FIRM|nr:ATP-binding protein [Orenia metallireducens]PRX29911.1 PAS domain S-box-containing protein [Orenia metallireducens]SNY25620.1 PAS domain S-box-containing protein [Orenia metallireducens]